MNKPSSRLKFRGPGLSARLLILTVTFVMVAEVLIFVPSIANFRKGWLEEHLRAAQIAALALEATEDFMVSEELARDLLATAGVEAVVLKRGGARKLILGNDMPINIAAVHDLRGAGPLTLILDSYTTLMLPDEALLQVTGDTRAGLGEYAQIIFKARALRAAMIDYARNILILSIIISLFTAGLVYLSLNWLLVRPVRRMTHSLIAFRTAPESITSRLSPTDRSDEMGVAERELATMQDELRNALNQKNRLANLGRAVSKINHDLRNILASAQLVSDRLATVDDPTVRAVAPRFVQALDRAIALCAQTLAYGRAEEPAPEVRRFALKPLVDEVGETLGLEGPDGGEGPVWCNEVDGALMVDADSDQLFRILLNLARNAADAIQKVRTPTPHCQIIVTASGKENAVAIDVADNGPGLSAQARTHLFEPFTGSARAGGTGLGLAIARELSRAHGGDIELVESGPEGTRFRVLLPRRAELD